MKITQEVFDRILRKNGRARKRMARRLMRKVNAANTLELGARDAQCKPYSPLEMELVNRVGRGWSAKTKRTYTKRLKDIEKSVAARARAKWPGIDTWNQK